MQFSVALTGRHWLGFLAISLATLAPQPSKALVLYSNDFDAGAPTVAAGITDSLTPGLIQTSVSVSPWWTGKYYANQTFSPTTLSLTGAVLDTIPLPRPYDVIECDGGRSDCALCVRVPFYIASAQANSV